MAGSSSTYSNYVLPPRLGIEQSVKANNSLHLTREQTKTFSDAGYHLRRDVAKRLLNLLEEGYERPPLTPEIVYYIVQPFEVDFC